MNGYGEGLYRYLKPVKQITKRDAHIFQNCPMGQIWPFARPISGPPCPMFDTPAVQCCIIFCMICPGYKIVLSNMAEIVVYSFKRLWRWKGNGNDTIAPPNH